MADVAQVACPHCGSLHQRPALAPGETALCATCGYEISRAGRLSLSAWQAIALAALLVFGIATFFPIVVLSFQGLQVQASLVDALWFTWRQGDYGLSIMVGLFAFWFPLTQILVTLWAVRCLLKGRLPGDFHLGMRLLRAATPWSMVPVLMLGILVALVKLADLATLVPGPAIIAFGVLTVLITMLTRLGSQRLWLHAEDAGLVPPARVQPNGSQVVAACESCGYLHIFQQAHQQCRCGRCGARVHFRHPGARNRAWALLIAAAIAYVPANLLPVMRIRTAASDQSHTILGGVIELWNLGSWDLAIIVFVASIVVPLTKIIALALLLLQSRWRGAAIQRQRTRLYEMVEFIGQWSMLDVFVVVLMGAMADFPGLSQIFAGPAAFSFGLVVVLTMLAAISYDPRQGWDARLGAGITKSTNNKPMLRTEQA